MEECCVICAEPLQFVAYGPCGHRDACVECVARLRFVMDDARCVICQQQCPRVFATRAMGDYTETIGAAGFATLPDRVRARELWHDKKLDMFFDDQATCRKIKDLRGLQCAACVSVAGGDAEGVEQHHSLKQLKAHLRERHQLHHCEVCLEGRKVFVSQQLLYTKSQLERHRHGGAGEVDEPLGGFAGHPSCKFCRKHFYDDGQMYHHMQSAHETCHLCRRAQPDKYTYYRDYAELEAHYRSGHHPCLHPECLAKKFVVFASPNELKNHEGLEHGRAMTKAERKEALRVHVDFNVGGTGGNGAGAGVGEGFGAGSSGGRDRGGRGDRGGGDASVARARAAALQRAAAAVSGGSVSAAEQAQLEAVLRASAGQETRDMPRTSSMEEFPDLGGGGAARGGGIVAGGWAGRGGGGGGGGGGGYRRGGGGGNGGTGGNIGSAEDFPSLGGGSGSARANVPIGGGRGGVPGAGRRPAPMPELPARAAEQLAARFAGLSGGASFAAASSGGGGSRGGSFGSSGSATSLPPASSEENFPSLGGSSNSSSGGVRPIVSGFARRAASDARKLAPASSAPPRPPPPTADDFPSMGGGAATGGGFVAVGKKSRDGGGGRWSNGGGVDFPSSGTGSSSSGNRNEGAKPSKKAAARAAAEAEAAAEAAAAAAMRNDQLVARVRTQLDAHGASFEVFANLSAQFKDGRVGAAAYLGKITAMGVDVDSVAELAALMPDGEKRAALERAVAAAERVKSRGNGLSGGGGGGGGSSSVDAAAAMLFGAAASDVRAPAAAAWDCPACTFHNAATNARCDVCDGSRPGTGTRSAGGGSSGGATGAGAGGSRSIANAGGRKGKKKGTTISLTAVGGGGVGGLDAFIPGQNRPAWG